jgi:hypothetical protein
MLYFVGKTGVPVQQILTSNAVIKLVIILFLNDEVQINLYLYIRNNDMHISPYIGGHRMVLHSLFQNV